MTRTISALIIGLVIALCVPLAGAQQPNTTRFTYDANGRLQSVTYPNGDVVTYSYDAAGNITSIGRQHIAPPTITGFNPTIGTPGTAVTITGTSFDSTPSNNQASFNGFTAAVSASTATTLTTAVPSGATSGHVTATSLGGSATSTGDFFVPPSPYTASQVAVADRMAVGQSKVVTLNTANTIGLILFDGTAGQQAGLVISNVTIPTSAVTIYKPDGSILGSAPNVTTSGALINSQALPATGTYTILVAPSGSSTGSLTLNLNNTNDVTGSMTIDGPPFTLAINAPGQKARITFTGNAGQGVSLDITNVALPNSNVSMLSPDGSVFGSAAGVTPSGTFISSQPLPATGTYTIAVDPLGNTGTMTLTLVSDVSATITLGGPATSINIVSPGQKAGLTFAGTSGQQVYFAIFNLSVPTCNVAVLNPDGTVLVSANGVPSIGQAIPAAALPASGTYTVRVDPLGSVGGISVFAAQIDSGPTISGFTPSVAALGDKVTITGTNFVATAPRLSNSVSFNGGIITPVDSATSTSIVAPVAGISGHLAVTTPSGTGISSGDFFIPPQPYAATDVVATARMASGDTRTFTFTNPHQIALIVFDAMAGQHLFVGFAVPITVPITALSVTGPDGGQVLGGNITSGSAGSFNLQRDLPLTGTYAISLAPENMSTGSFTITLGISNTINGSLAVDGPPAGVTLSAPGQSAQFTFNPNAGDTLSVGLSGLIFPANVSLAAPNSPPQFVGSVTASSGIVTLGALQSTGTYTLVVSAGGSATGTGNVRVFHSVIAGAITLNGPPVTVTIPITGQTAQLALNAGASQNIFIRTSQMTVTCVVTLVAPDGSTSLQSILTGTDALLEADNLPVTGTYFVKVAPVNQGTGSLTLAAYTVTDVTDTLTIGGPAATETITTPGQKIRLSFAGTAGQFVNLQIANPTIQSGNIQVTNPDGSVLFTSAFTSSTIFALGSLPATGTYAIVITASGVQTGSVTLSLFADLSTTITIDGPPVSVTINIPGQEARLTFSGTTGQHVNLTISIVSIPNGAVTIFAPDGSSAASQAVDTNGGVLSIASLPQTGTYTIVINPASQGTGSAQLQLSSPTDVVRAITIDGGQVSETIDTPGQNGRLQFAGTAGHNVRLLITFLNISSFNLSIQNPDGTDVTGGANPILINTNGTAIEIRNLLQTGTYTVIVAPVGQATGSVTFSLTSTNVGVLTAGIPSYEIITSTTATAVHPGPGDSVAIIVPPPQQQINLSFTGSAGQQMSLSATGHLRSNGSQMVASIKITAPDGTVVAQVNGTTGPVTLQTSGQYIVTVTIFGIGVLSSTVTLTGP
jgi:YD repeat-containing protein